MKNYVSNGPEFIFQYCCPHYVDGNNNHTYVCGYYCDCNRDQCEYYHRDLPNKELCALVVDLKKNPNFKFSDFAISRKEKNMTSDKRRDMRGVDRDMGDMLIDRVIVEMRDGTKLMVFGNDVRYKVLVDISDNDFEPGRPYMWDKNLTWLGRSPRRGPNEKYDIVKIYEPCFDYVLEKDFNFDTDGWIIPDYKWAWKRTEDTTTRWDKKSDPKPKEMTVAEIEEELGYSVKIVKEDV